MLAVLLAAPCVAAAQGDPGAPVIPDKPPLPGDPDPDRDPTNEPGPPATADDASGALSDAPAPRGGPVGLLRITNGTGTETPLSRSLLAAARGAVVGVMRDAGWQVVMPQYSAVDVPAAVRHRVIITLALAAHNAQQVRVAAHDSDTVHTRTWHDVRVAIELDTRDGREPLVIRRAATGATLLEAVKRLNLVDVVTRALQQRIPPALRVHRAVNQVVNGVPLTVVGGRADAPVGSLVRLRYGEAEDSGFAEVLHRNADRHALTVRPFDWPDEPAGPANQSQLWVEPLAGIGLRLSGGIGFMLTHNDETPLDVYIIPERTGSVVLALQLAWDYGAPLFGQPGLLVELGFQFTQGSPMKAAVLELAFRGDLWLAECLSLTPGLGVGIGINELSHISLASVFGSTRTKARQTIISITPGVEVAWRLMPSLSVHAQVGWRFVITPAGHDVFNTQGVEAEIDGINAESGRLYLQLGLRLFF